MDVAAPSPKSLANIQRNGKPVAGFKPGNEVRKTHGAGTIQTTKRAEELYDELLPQVPVWNTHFELALRNLASKVARKERIELWLDERPLFDRAGRIRPAMERLDQLENGILAHLKELGMTALSQSKLGLNLQKAKGAALDQHMKDTYDK